jgi:hypothetical protein
MKTFFECLSHRRILKSIVSATELLEKIKSLPPFEQAAFAALFHRWEASANRDASLLAKTPIQMPDYAARLKKLFPDGPIQGDPQTFWDELRMERL